jgi:hypothetical protein
LLGILLASTKLAHEGECCFRRTKSGTFVPWAHGVRRMAHGFLLKILFFKQNIFSKQQFITTYMHHNECFHQRFLPIKKKEEKQKSFFWNTMILLEWFSEAIECSGTFMDQIWGLWEFYATQLKKHMTLARKVVPNSSKNKPFIFSQW